MFAKNPQPPNPNKETISKHLRQADEFTRVNRYDEALIEINKALALDPRNQIARSFQERVRLLQKRMKKEEKPEAQDLSLEQRMAIISQLLQEAEELVSRQDYKRALDKVAEVYSIDPTNYYAQAFSDRIEQLQREQAKETAKLFKSPVPAPTQQQSEQETLDLSRGSLQMYREMLKEVWFDGKVTEEEAANLKRTRDIFGITAREHSALERQVKLDAYVEALRLAWRDGMITENERSVLEMMRTRYGISAEEHGAAESKIQAARRATASKAVVLMVDSAKESVVPAAKALQQHGYDVVIAGRVEEAFQVLVNRVPDIIMSEIFFTANGIDGFSFYTKAREHPRLKSVPFFFYTSVKDLNVVRAALRLGADYLLAKPTDPEFLVALIDGRLRKE